MATHVKHNHLNDAKRKISRIQVEIDNLNREIKDVQQDVRVNINLNIDDCLKFADYFFDGLIFDFTVQNKISSTLNAVRNLIDKLKTLELNFNSLSNDASKELERLKSQRKDAIIQYT